MANFNKKDLIAGKSIENNEKYKFLVKYATSKGWDSDNLSKEQLMEIKSQEGYKKAGLMLS